MAETQTVRVKNLREFLRAIAKADKETRTEVRAAIREAAEPVRQEAMMLFSPVDARSAVGYRVVVRQRGVAVEQRLRRTTGQHPEFGALQMRRALLPALDHKRPQVMDEVDKALERIAAHFNGGGL